MTKTKLPQKGEFYKAYYFTAWNEYDIEHPCFGTTYNFHDAVEFYTDLKELYQHIKVEIRYGKWDIPKTWSIFDETTF